MVVAEGWGGEDKEFFFETAISRRTRNTNTNKETYPTTQSFMPIRNIYDPVKLLCINEAYLIILTATRVNLNVKRELNEHLLGVKMKLI